MVLSCTSREKPYSCKLVELQDLNTFPVIDLTPTSIALTDTTLLNPEKIWISDTLLIIKDAETDENKFLKYYNLPVTIICTKYDKVNRSARIKQDELIKNTLTPDLGDEIVNFSSVTKFGKDRIYEIIENIINKNS